MTSLLGSASITGRTPTADTTAPVTQVSQTIEALETAGGRDDAALVLGATQNGWPAVRDYAGTFADADLAEEVEPDPTLRDNLVTQATRDLSGLSNVALVATAAGVTVSLWYSVDAGGAWPVSDATVVNYGGPGAAEANNVLWAIVYADGGTVVRFYTETGAGVGSFLSYRIPGGVPSDSRGAVTLSRSASGAARAWIGEYRLGFPTQLSGGASVDADGVASGFGASGGTTAELFLDEPDSTQLQGVYVGDTYYTTLPEDIRGGRTFTPPVALLTNEQAATRGIGASAYIHATSGGFDDPSAPISWTTGGGAQLLLGDMYVASTTPSTSTASTVYSAAVIDGEAEVELCVMVLNPNAGTFVGLNGSRWNWSLGVWTSGTLLRFFGQTDAGATISIYWQLAETLGVNDVAVLRFTRSVAGVMRAYQDDTLLTVDSTTGTNNGTSATVPISSLGGTNPVLSFITTAATPRYLVVRDSIGLAALP